MSPGILYVVGTPIGNLEDISVRALNTLKAVNWIASEDTRHTGKLLHHFGITTPQISYHHHNRSLRQQQLLDWLHQGQSIALVSDAGMPSISDPGYELIEAAIAEELKVVPIPGPTAVITALTGSGLKTDKFTFEGFLPPKTQERRNYLTQLQSETRTMVFYEAPHRLQSTIQDLLEVFGPTRRIAVCRELTKLYEDFWRGTLWDAQIFYSDYHPKGEYTLVVEGAPNQGKLLTSSEEISQELASLLKQGLSLAQASKQLAPLTNLTKREVYQIGLTINS